MLAIIYDHIGRESQVCLGLFERARYLRGIGGVDFTGRASPPVTHVHPGTRPNCDFEVVLHQLERNGL
jgi:hypothetical protein